MLNMNTPAYPCFLPLLLPGVKCWALLGEISVGRESKTKFLRWVSRGKNLGTTRTIMVNILRVLCVLSAQLEQNPTTSLIPQSLSMSSEVQNPLLSPEEEGEEKGRKGKGSWWSLDTVEAKVQVQFAVPMVLTNVSYYAIPLISVMFAGHLGDVELAGATLANSWASVTAFAFTVGLSGALETLCGQNYGAKLYKMLGVHLQASLILSFLSSILISILWIYTEQVLIFFHQDPQISMMAAIYLRYLIPGIFAYAFLQCILRFLQTQSVVMPLVVCSVLPLVFHVVLTYLLVHVWGMGYKGASLAVGISLWVSFLMMGFYVNFSSRFRHTWGGPSTECFKYILPNLRLAVPSAIMVCLEFWAFEILVLLAGLMSESQTATSVIAMCVTTEAIVYNFIIGFSAAVSTRVSNELGAGNANKAKNAIEVTLKLAIVLGATIVLLILLFHDHWAKLFSDSSIIIYKFAQMTPFLAVSLLLDSAQGVLSGVARGCGWQHLAAWTNLIAFYGIGMTLSVVFGFVLDLHIKGLWLGLICGLFCQFSTLLFITIRTNWENLGLYVEESKQDDFLA